MFAVVTDSTAYLTRAEAERLGVEMVGMGYSDGTSDHTESFTDCNGRFDKLIGSGRWTTSQVSAATFSEVFERLLVENEQVLCLTISSRLSGTHANALSAAKETGKGRVFVFDSLSAAGGLKLQVKRACALREMGISASGAMRALEAERQSVRVVFSVDSMEPLRRSGRIGMVRQAIGTVLDIRPVLALQGGAVYNHKLSRGKTDRIRKLIGCVPEGATEIDVCYFGAPESAVQLMSGLKAKLADAELSVSGIGPVLAIHLGLTALGVAFRVWSDE